MTSSSADESQNHPEKTQTQNVQQIVTTTISNNNAKFPYLEKDEYETWAMKMEYWIMNRWDDSEFSVFTPTPEDVEGTPLYNRFVKIDRMKAVPPPLSGNYIPLSDPTDLDESQMTYGPKQTILVNLEPQNSDLDSCESNSSVESLKSMPKPVIIEPKTSKYASKLEVAVIDEVINSPCYHNKELASPEQTATGKDISNPFMAVMTCQKSYSSSTSYDSCSESGKWFQSSMDHPLSGPRLDADFHNAGRIVRNYEFLVPTGSYTRSYWQYKVPTGSTQFLLVVRFSLPGLLESPGLMESIKRHSV
ncbi:hypothetical protein Tco_0092931 [Tanacetum coccineum]